MVSLIRLALPQITTTWCRIYERMSFLLIIFKIESHQFYHQCKFQQIRSSFSCTIFSGWPGWKSQSLPILEIMRFTSSLTQREWRTLYSDEGRTRNAARRRDISHQRRHGHSCRAQCCSQFKEFTQQRFAVRLAVHSDSIAWPGNLAWSGGACQG